MKEIIQAKLCELERREEVRILFAAESGSRAWGFESPDSDYDVRFVYVRPTEWYLRLEETRDVIEEPIDSVFDMAGWDLSKALRLVYRSNPTLFEWLDSPIVYRSSERYEKLRETARKYFQPKSALYHYLNMAKNNYRNYLKCDMVKAKKYFYVLRPLLACRWILEKGCPPPVRFAELAEQQMEPGLKPQLERLLELKRNAPETKEIEKISELNAFIDEELEGIERMTREQKRRGENGWEELNRLFLSELRWKQ